MVVTGVSAAAATASATFDELFDEVRTVVHELSTLGETIMYNEAAGAQRQQHFADRGVDAVTALVKGSLLQMASGTMLAVDHVDPVFTQPDNTLAIRLVATPGGPNITLSLAAARQSVTAVLPGVAWPGVAHTSVMGGVPLTLRLSYLANGDVAALRIDVAGVVRDQQVSGAQLAQWLGRSWTPATTAQNTIDQGQAGQLVQQRGVATAQLRDGSPLVSVLQTLNAWALSTLVTHDGQAQARHLVGFACGLIGESEAKNRATLALGSQLDHPAQQNYRSPSGLMFVDVLERAFDRLNAKLGAAAPIVLVDTLQSANRLQGQAGAAIIQQAGRASAVATLLKAAAVAGLERATTAPPPPPPSSLGQVQGLAGAPNAGGGAAARISASKASRGGGCGRVGAAGGGVALGLPELLVVRVDELVQLADVAGLRVSRV